MHWLWHLITIFSTVCFSIGLLFSIRTAQTNKNLRTTHKLYVCHGVVCASFSSCYLCEFNLQINVPVSVHIYSFGIILVCEWVGERWLFLHIFEHYHGKRTALINDRLPWKRMDYSGSCKGISSTRKFIVFFIRLDRVWNKKKQKINQRKHISQSISCLFSSLITAQSNHSQIQRKRFNETQLVICLSNANAVSYRKRNN